MKVLTATISENAFTDSLNSLSVIQIFDNINVTTLPTIFPKMAITLRFKLEQSDMVYGTHTYKLQIIKQDGIDIFNNNGPISQIEIKPGIENIQMVFTLVGIQLTLHGIYTINLLENDKRINASGLDLTFKVANKNVGAGRPKTDTLN